MKWSRDINIKRAAAVADGCPDKLELISYLTILDFKLIYFIP